MTSVAYIFSDEIDLTFDEINFTNWSDGALLMKSNSLVRCMTKKNLLMTKSGVKRYSWELEFERVLRGDGTFGMMILLG